MPKFSLSVNYAGRHLLKKYLRMDVEFLIIKNDSRMAITSKFSQSITNRNKLKVKISEP